MYYSFEPVEGSGRSEIRSARERPRAISCLADCRTTVPPGRRSMQEIDDPGASPNRIHCDRSSSSLGKVPIIASSPRRRSMRTFSMPISLFRLSPNTDMLNLRTTRLSNNRSDVRSDGDRIELRNVTPRACDINRKGLRSASDRRPCSRVNLNSWLQPRNYLESVFSSC